MYNNMYNYSYDDLTIMINFLLKLIIATILERRVYMEECPSCDSSPCINLTQLQLTLLANMKALKC